MDIIITTSDPDLIEDNADAIWAAIENLNLFVNSIEVRCR